MKNLLITFLMLIVGSTVNAQFTEATLQASGLTCAMCSKAVKNALEKVEFVEEVKVNIKDQEYMLAFKDGSDVDFDVLKKAVQDAGFSVASLKVKTHVDALEIVKDKHVTIGGKYFHFLNTQKKPVQGDVVFSIVDKDFVTDKAFKKYAASTNMQCVQTGTSQSCCEKTGIPAAARVYHVII